MSDKVYGIGENKSMVEAATAKETSFFISYLGDGKDPFNEDVYITINKDSSEFRVDEVFNRSDMFYVSDESLVRNKIVLDNYNRDFSSDWSCCRIKVRNDSESTYVEGFILQQEYPETLQLLSLSGIGQASQDIELNDDMEYSGSYDITCRVAPGQTVFLFLALRVKNKLGKSYRPIGMFVADFVHASIPSEDGEDSHYLEDVDVTWFEDKICSEQKKLLTEDLSIGYDDNKSAFDIYLKGDDGSQIKQVKFYCSDFTYYYQGEDYASADIKYTNSDVIEGDLTFGTYKKRLSVLILHKDT